MKKIAPAFLLLLFAFIEPSILKAPDCVGLTGIGSGYQQNFNTLATSGTANTSLPVGWFLNETGTATRVNQAYAASTGSDNAGDTYSFGASASTERAFGTL